MTTIPCHRPCRTCGQTHPFIPGAYSTDCLMIGGKFRNKTHRKTHQSQNHLTTLPIPYSIRDQALIFDELWFLFHDIKHQNSHFRRDLAALKLGRGGIKQFAPLPWLRWKRVDGSKGQTRNQENYDKLWKTFVHTTLDNGQNVPVAWLTICAMTCTLPLSSCCSEGEDQDEDDDDDDNDNDSECRKSEYSVRKRDVERVSFPFCKAPGSPIYQCSVRMGQAR